MDTEMLESAVIDKMESLKSDSGLTQVEMSPPTKTEMDYITEISTRMNVEFKECYVLLHRLTEEEIYRSYHDSDDEINDDIRIKTEELCKTVEAMNHTKSADMYITNRRDGTKRRMREVKHNNSELFEQYRRKRKKFLNRGNKSTHSENSLDWSQDVFRNFRDDIKRKKKSRRGRKYEHDFEWSPNMSKNSLKNDRKLRSCARRAVFESESSSTDEDDILFNTFIDGDADNDYYFPKSAFENSLPSEFNGENVSTSVKVVSGENVLKDYSSVQYGTSNMNEDFNHNSGSSFQKCDSKSCDVVSSIIKDMNQFHGNKVLPSSKNTLKCHNRVSNNVKVNKRRRKRLKLSSNDKTSNVEKDVAIILKNMVTKVAAELKGKGKILKSCKWCTTKFYTSINSEVLCAICLDAGIGKYESGVKTPSTNSKKTKPSKESKCKKISKTMSQVLKKLPKNERQRLTYIEKSDKEAVEKGYNHCKSFITPKDIDENINVLSNKSSYLPNREKKEFKKKNNSSQIIKNQNVNKQKKMRIDNENNQKNKCVSLKPCHEGLFLMTFPDPDQGLDLLDKALQSQKIQVTGTNLINSENIDVINKNSASVCSNTNHLQSANNKQFDRYLFPPISTVVVSNYSNDTKSMNLSHIYYQNELTRRHLHENINVPSTEHLVKKSDLNKKIFNANSIGSISNNLSSQSTCFTTSNLITKNAALTFTTIPVNKSLRQLQSLSGKPVSVLKPETSIVTTVAVMPVISPVISLSSISTIQANTVKENSAKIFSSNNFKDLQITISNVVSQKVNSSPNSVVLESSNENNINKLVDSVKSSEISISRKRKNRSSSECSETMEDENLTNEEASMNSETSDILSTASSKFPEDKSKPMLDTDDSTEQSLSDHSNSNRLAGIKESGSQGASVLDILDAVSILAVIDLEKNPQSGLNVRIQSAEENVSKLSSEKNATPEHNKKLAESQYHLQLLYIAKAYLSLYGSFIKVSDFLLRKAQRIQIKKEKMEEANQSSCMFSQSSQLNNSIANTNSNLTRSTEIPVMAKTSNLNSNQTAINHIEKMESQIAAMNNVSQYGLLPTGGTVHHYPAEQIAALPPAVAAPTPITPRNECLVGESRETPSRGSGPRTPARPESAASQSEEQALVQIKKEQFEGTSSPTSQCAFSQNTTLSQISSQLSVQEMPSMNTSKLSVSNTTVNLPINNTNQTNLHLQSRDIVPNRTVAYSNNQNYSGVLLNMATKHSQAVSITPVTSNPQISQNRSVLLGQQMFIQNGSGLCPKQTVPSINTNQYIVRPPPYTSTSTGGTVIVNNPQVAQNALLTNVSNQQFYTTNQVSQLYYPPPSQITCISSNNISTIASPDVTAAQIQQTELESPEQMLCAVCRNQATLRCKQCARVAYCNTTCAKTYWHQKHKMECKPLGS